MQLEYINIDGELDSTYERRKRVIAATGHAARIGTKLAKVAQNGLKELVTPVYLDYVDTRNGSHLRDQYFAAKRAGEVATVAQLVGIEYTAND